MPQPESCVRARYPASIFISFRRSSCAPSHTSVVIHIDFRKYHLQRIRCFVRTLTVRSSKLDKKQIKGDQHRRQWRIRNSIRAHRLTKGTPLGVSAADCIELCSDPGVLQLMRRGANCKSSQTCKLRYLAALQHHVRLWTFERDTELLKVRLLQHRHGRFGRKVADTVSSTSSKTTWNV